MEKLTPLCLKTEDMAETKPRILFVCTGNTCRSPMAAAYLRSFGRHDAFSRGIAACEGDPMAVNAVRALKSAGIASTPENDYESHRASNVTAVDMESADVIVTMTGRHTAALIFAFPQFAEKIRTMESPVVDPYGGDVSVYKKTLSQLSAAINSMFLTKRTGDGEQNDEE